MDNIEYYSGFASVVNVIRRRFKQFIALIIGGMLIVLVYSFIMPYEFRSKTSLLPSTTSESSGLSSFLQNMTGGNLLSGAFKQSTGPALYADVIKSRSVAEYIIDSLRLTKSTVFSGWTKNEIVELIQEKISTEIDKSGLLTVELSLATGMFPSNTSKDTVKMLSAKMLNKAVDGLNHIFKNKNISSARKTRIYIERSLAEYRNKLDSLEKRLEIFKDNYKLLAIDAQTEAIIGQAVALGTELTKAEIELSIARQDYAEESHIVKSAREAVELLRSQYDKAQQGGLSANDAYSIPLKDVPRIERLYTSFVRDQKILNQVILYLETQRHQEAIQEERDLPVLVQLDEANIPEKQSSPRRGFMLLLSSIIIILLTTVGFVTHAVLKGSLILKSNE